MHHRWWCCPATEALREELTSKATRRRAKDAGPASLLYSCGLVEHPDCRLVGPSDDLCQRIGMRRDDGSWEEKEFDGTVPDELQKLSFIFVDGSCTTESLAERRRAAWAVVWADGEGKAVGEA